MKVAIAFLLVALSCYLGTGYATYGKGKPVSSHGPIIPKDCLEKLIKVDVPQTLLELQEMLCLYITGMKTKNQQLYREFLMQLHEALKTAGCTVDQILTLPQFLEKVGDEVGKVAEELGFELLNLVDELGLNKPVFDFLCELLGETLKSLSQSLAGLNLKAPTSLLSGGKLPLIG